MKKGEVWFVDLPEGKGHEQKGMRPAIILCRANAAAVVVPLTSNTNKATFSFTLPIEPTSENGLKEYSIALVFQMASMDDSRFKRQVGAITKAQQDAIDILIVEMLKIQVK
ncbi:PemK-like, MazF-like toxin of type II toxin-antitoxin system [uncultured archaeon]|nr:PemK-like, MazF-like toxin of type II toxin-antitoxin system [uncultured archaeon]